MLDKIAQQRDAKPPNGATRLLAGSFPVEPPIRIARRLADVQTPPSRKAAVVEQDADDGVTGPAFVRRRRAQTERGAFGPPHPACAMRGTRCPCPRGDRDFGEALGRDDVLDGRGSVAYRGEEPGMDDLFDEDHYASQIDHAAAAGVVVDKVTAGEASRDRRGAALLRDR